MPSRSKSQQRLFGMALSYKRGNLDIKKYSKSMKAKLKKLAEISEKKLAEYAKTKHKKIPEKVSEEILNYQNFKNIYL